MTNDEIIGQVCLSCGDCCTGLPHGPYCTPEDIARIVRWAGLADKLQNILERLRAWLNPDAGTSSYCPAMSIANGKCRCSIYPARPSMCRDWECDIITHLRILLENPTDVDSTNPLRVLPPSPVTYNVRLLERAQQLTPRMVKGYSLQPLVARFRRRPRE